MHVGDDVLSSCDRFVGALASTRLPDVSTTKELGEATLDDSRITRMLEDFATSYGWVPNSEFKQIHTQGKGEDMLWLWCMYSLWTDTNCTDLLPTTCRPGWYKKTNGEQFKPWLNYKGKRERADVACFFESDGHPDHALFCELEYDTRLRGAPVSPEDHKDFFKIAKNSTRLPVTHVLIYGSLYPKVTATRTDFRLSSSEQAAYLVITR